MKKIFLTFMLLASSASIYAGNEVSRLEGNWKGNYADRQMRSTFMISLKSDGSVTYSDNSSLGPYCKGKVVKDTRSKLKLKLNCNKVVSSSFFSKTKELELTIYNPYQLEAVEGTVQIASVDSSIVGEQEVSLEKLSSFKYGDLSSEDGGFSGMFTVSKNGEFVGNMSFTLDEYGKLAVNSGYLIIDNLKHVFGENLELIDGYEYIVPNYGEYLIKNNALNLSILDDQKNNFAIRLDLEALANEFISTYNLYLPKDIKLKETKAFINGVEYSVALFGSMKP